MVIYLNCFYLGCSDNQGGAQREAESPEKEVPAAKQGWNSEGSGKVFTID